MKRAIWLVLILSSALVTGCYRADWQMTVSNESGQSWYVAVNQPDGFRFVDLLDVGAHGVSLSWTGDATNPIEVLDLNCQKVGTFEATDGVTWTVVAVPGLTATIQKPTGFLSIGGAVEEHVGITQANQCGAAYYM